MLFEASSSVPRRRARRASRTRMPPAGVSDFEPLAGGQRNAVGRRAASASSRAPSTRAMPGVTISSVPIPAAAPPPVQG